MGPVLGILREAGGTGITGPEIARQFTHDTLQRRMCVVNQVLYRLRHRQRVIRGPKEPTKYYHRVPTYRWFITPAGVHYLATGMEKGARQARWEQAERKRAELAEYRRHLADLLTEAYDRIDPQTAPKCERERVMRELRTAGCTLESIGEVFGVTRERVRQVLNRQNVTPCRCGRCAAQPGDGCSGA
jgi:hypothetical protein